MSGPLPVLVAASGAAWEAAALERLRAAEPGVLLLKRCVDLSDLLVSASTGQARAALVSADLPGLDADSVAGLRKAGVGVVMVAGVEQLADGVGARADRLGVGRLVADTDLGGVVDVLRSAGKDVATSRPALDDAAEAAEAADPGGSRSGTLVAVWGPAGAPGRTTVAVGIAAELARRGSPTFLVDADPYGGTVAQHLGVLDEVSGLLAAARIANAGHLDEARLVGLARQVGPGLRLLTGLPRADRWSEVRAPAFAGLLAVAAGVDNHVVVDTGFSLESDPSALDAPVQRNEMTLTALEAADEIMVVGTADPVGLSRLARGLVELRGLGLRASTRVVVNRTRASLGWKEADIRSLLGDFADSTAALHLLPDDRAAVDHALVAGRSLSECGDSSLRRGLTALVDGLLGVNTRARRSVFGRRSGRRQSR
ncbi:MAG TPA: hypothetical protein VFT75_06265 [Nocardioidaceae bacterium]|nr:hypothetical protein [Nocardioidaceae bacterium]